jgi:amino acid transporter
MSGLKRALGLPTLIFYGLGTILGAGIYSVLGAAAGRAGDAVWLSLVASALVALLTALSYAELATTYPQAGAEYVYLRRALPRWRSLAFVAGLMMVTSGAATAATVSLAFAGYLGEFVRLHPVVVAGLLMATLTGVALWGIRQSAGVNVVCTLVEAAGLLLVVGVGIAVGGFADALATPPSWGVVGGASLVFFSYLGFENVANLVEEAKEPERHVPAAILGSLGAATVLYVLVALAAVALLPPAELAASEAPLATAVGTHAPRAAPVLAAVALFATANTALVSLLSASRLLYGMAKGGELPRRIAAVSGSRRTPWLATLLVAAIAAVLLPLGSVEAIASVSSFAALLAFASVNAALLILRRREPRRARPFRVPLVVGGVAALPLLGLASTLALLTQLAPAALVSGGALLVAALAAYAVFGRGTSA